MKNLYKIKKNCLSSEVRIKEMYLGKKNNCITEKKTLISLFFETCLKNCDIDQKQFLNENDDYKD